MTSLFHRINQEFNNVPICFTRRKLLANLARHRCEGQKISRYKSLSNTCHIHLRARTKLRQPIFKGLARKWKGLPSNRYRGCSIEIYIRPSSYFATKDATIHYLHLVRLILSNDNRVTKPFLLFYLKTKCKMQNDACLVQGTRTNPLRNGLLREEGDSNPFLSVSFSRYTREEGGGRCIQRELDTSLINTWRKRIFLSRSETVSRTKTNEN